MAYGKMLRGSVHVDEDGMVVIPGIQVGQAQSYAEIDHVGRMVLYGAATLWDDIYPTSVSTAVGVANPSFTAYSGGNMKAYEFVGAAAAKELHIGFQFPHDYKEGSDVVPHVHLYVPDDETGGVVKFGLEYTWVNVDDAGAEPATDTITGTITRGASAGVLQNAKLSFGTVTGTGKKISSIFMARLYRDPTDEDDTFGSSVWLKSADIHREIDTIGSRGQFTK